MLQVEELKKELSYYTWKEIQTLCVEAMLEKCSGNRTHASRDLGISIRTIRNKIREINANKEEACRI